MKFTVILAALLAITLSAVEGSAVTLDPYRVPETMDLSAAARMLKTQRSDPGSKGNVYLLADLVSRFEKSLSEVSTGIENVGLLVPYLSTTDYGPKEVTQHLMSFMDELKDLQVQAGGIQHAAELALASAQPGDMKFAAQALKQSALSLRSRQETLLAMAGQFKTNVLAHQAVLGRPAVLAVQEVSDRQCPALAETGDALVSIADQLIRKVQ